MYSLVSLKKIHTSPQELEDLVCQRGNGRSKIDRKNIFNESFLIKIDQKSTLRTTVYTP